jgi:hypothetical protein
MKKVFLLFILSFKLLFSQNNISFEFMSETIEVESRNSELNYDENYNYNNKVYAIDSKFTYKYYYINQEGKKFLMKRGKKIQHFSGHSTYDWDFANIDDTSNDVVKEIIATIIAGNPFEKMLQDYNQTGVSYKYITNDNMVYSSEVTGIVENIKNTWKHPPRNNLFGILELNPFPFIKKPFEIGNKWTWSLEIGENWGDERWLKWKGSITNKYSYEITEFKEVDTYLGKINCYIIQSEAISNIGTTKLISFYNEEFGFVKLNYTNIDGTQLNIDLVKKE